MSQVTEKQVVARGRYRHFQGTEYRVFGTVRNQNTDEETVVCRQISGDRSLWSQSKAAFLESVEVDGQQVPRFQLLEEY